MKELRTSLHEFTAAEKEQVLAYYRTHKAEVTARAFGTTYHTVWRIAREAGVKKTAHTANPLESKLQRMKHQRFILNGVGWTVTINGFEIEGKEVRVLLKGEKREVKPRVYPLKSAASRLDEDFLKITR